MEGDLVGDGIGESVSENKEVIVLATEKAVDEKEVLGALDSFITKSQKSIELRDTVNAGHRRLGVAENEELALSHRVDNLESRLKLLQKQVFIGSAKPGEVGALSKQLEEDKAALSGKRLALIALREAFCLEQEALAEVGAEREGFRKQLIQSLPLLFEQRFGGRDASLYGARGTVSWADADPNSPERWRKAWRMRAFRLLFSEGILKSGDNCRHAKALTILFKEKPFKLRIVSGFVPVGSSGVLEVDEIVSVPDRLTYENSFEELGRGRVEFLVE